MTRNETPCDFWRVYVPCPARCMCRIMSFSRHDDAGRWAAKRFDVGDGQTHVFEPRRLERLEAEHIADDGCGEVRDRAFLEQRKIVCDIAEILSGLVWNRLDPVRLGAIHVAGG